MTKTVAGSAADYVQPLFMNGLEGRMLYMPAPKGKARHILFVYGHHASLERQFGALQILNRYGSVTAPDLPGFGGMQSIYSIGLKPSLDNLADYLAAFVKMRYKRKKVTIVAMSFGFAVVTRMLQKFPELVPKVNMLVSIVGFTHHDEFVFSRRTHWALRYGASLMSNRVPAYIGQTFLLRPMYIRTAYKISGDKNPKLRGASAEEQKARIAYEVDLWRQNDLRTYMDTAVTMLKLDLLHHTIKLPLYHVNVLEDRYFDHHVVEQHLNIIYDKVTVIRTKQLGHGPTMLLDEASAQPFFPAGLKRALARKPS